MPLLPRAGTPVTLPQTISVPIRPVGGLNTSLPARDLDPSMSPDMLNLRVLNGALTKRPGYVQHFIGNTAFGSEVMGLHSARAADGTWYLYAATPTGFYVYSAAGQHWHTVTGTALTGSTNTPFSFAVSQNKLAFCQGVDAVQVTDLNGATYAALNANCPPARQLERFGQRLVLGCTVESAVDYAFRARWSIASDHTNWIGTGSGFRDNEEDPYRLQALKKLVGALGVYYDNAIEIVVTTGTTPPFQFTTVVPDTGLYASRLLAGYRDSHIFLGSDDFYVFNGSVLTPIGAAIRAGVFDGIYQNVPRMHFAECFTPTQEYWAFLCMGSASTPNYVYVYNWGSGVWYPWTCNGPRAAAVHRIDTSPTIDALVGTIDAQYWQMNEAMMRAAAPAFFTGHSDGKVYVWGAGYPSDDGVAFLCKWTSKDFTSEGLGAPAGHMVTLDRIAFEYYDHGVSTTFTFYYSNDGGATWSPGQPVTFGGDAAGWKFAKVDYQINGPRVRFRFENLSATSRFTIGALYPQVTVQEGVIV